VFPVLHKQLSGEMHSPFELQTLDEFDEILKQIGKLQL
jgi:hypothetical protein